MIHIIRHGQALHNVERGYPHRDPPLTVAGQEATRLINIPTSPDLIIISPMTRTIQTAINVFPSLLDPAQVSSQVEVQIWPDLRESHDAICNKGLSKAELSTKFPQFNFAECSEEWDYPPHTIEGATIRAEEVRRRLKELSKNYRNIAVVTHRGFIAYLIQGDRFNVCETRSYRFATDEEVKANAKSLRIGVNVDTNETCDFGPTVLIPVEIN
ncbi:hypothetical protein TWF730_008546 [Orbilia blumenaviensis]|uniref:Phosphoglycerate mutase-like protein n=1 Tax=Orbilia blumenaviensis TaxID=1796055 RepID=A0AAV9V2S4_9PEZI